MLWFIAIFKTVFIDITLPNNKLPEQIFQDYPSTEPYARLMYTTVKFVKVKKIRTSPKALVHEIFKKYERNSFLSFKLLFWYIAVTFSTDRSKWLFKNYIILHFLSRTIWLVSLPWGTSQAVTNSDFIWNTQV